MRDLLNISLKKRSISELHFLISLPLEDNVISMLNDASSPDEDDENNFIDSFKIGKDSHVALATVSQNKKNSNIYKIDCICYLKRGGRIGRDIPRMSQLFDILSTIDAPQNINCLIRFKYGKRDKYKPIYNFPLRVNENQNAPFNEIHGVHFAKVTKKQLEYEVIVDLLDEGGYTVTVIFKYRSKIDRTLVENIVEKAQLISQNFTYLE